MESNLTNIPLPLTLGLDPTTNELISIDLGICGNILLAGATKQGKSHCIHNMISQMNALPTPPEMILFDPKRWSSHKDRFPLVIIIDELLDLISQIQNFEICFRPQSL